MKEEHLKRIVARVSDGVAHIKYAGAWGTTALLLLFIGTYRMLFSPILAPCCRLSPSCSHYAKIAIGRFGAWRGGWLAFKRLCRCQPWQPGGFDPVPECNHLPMKRGTSCETV